MRAARFVIMLNKVGVLAEAPSWLDESAIV
jgi:hypothetical protein